MSQDLIPLSDQRFIALNKRKLTEESNQKWKYGVATYRGKKVQVANYFNEAGTIVAQKIRTADKDFLVLGKLKKALPLFGQHLWRDGTAKGKVIITEGEVDAVSMSQVQDHKWPVVSVPNGAAGAKKAVAAAMNWLSTFGEVVFMFDNDDPGIDAANECAQLFPHGKAKIATLPLKDANEMVKAGRVKELMDAVWSARVYRPEAVSSVEDLFEKATEMPEMGLSWPWETLTKLTYGVHRKKAYYWGAGVGVGKTNQAKEHQSHIVNVHKLPVGVFMLEEAPGRTLKGIAGKFHGIPFHKPDADFTQEQLKDAIRSLNNKVHVYRHDLMGTDWESVKPAMIYMVEGLGVKDIFLDNLTVLVAHLEPSEANTEINRIAKDIAHLLNKHDFTLYGYSHLNPPKSGPAHENGGRVHESQFTGSRGLMRFGQYMLGIERNKDPELEEEERNTSHFVLLKDRDYGNVGRFPVFYNKDTDQYLEPTEDQLLAGDNPYGFEEEDGSDQSKEKEDF